MRMTKLIVTVSAVAVLSLSASSAFAGKKHSSGGTSFNVSGSYASGSLDNNGQHSTGVGLSISGATGNASAGGGYYAKGKTDNNSTCATAGGLSFASSGHSSY